MDLINAENLKAYWHLIILCALIFGLLVFFIYKFLVPSQRLKGAFKLFLQSAELGYGSAYFSLALAYLDKDGVKKDLNESLKCAVRDVESGGAHGYYIAADCLVEAGMKEQASDMWRRCFKERTTEEIQIVLLEYRRHAAVRSVEQVHSKKIARLISAVAEENKDLAIRGTGYQGAVECSLVNQVT